MKARGYKPTDPTWARGPERLQKLLAKAGFGSRRAAEEWIESGRVTVNGRPVSEPGAKADPSRDDIRVDNERIQFPESIVYALNKPAGVLCTNRDEQGRNDKLVVNLVPQPTVGRLFPVGRLDKDSEGLLLITNDGELCNRLTHPRHEVPKTYRVTVRGYFSPEHQQRLIEGIWLSDGKAKPDKVIAKKRHRRSSVVDVVLSEGRNREIRRLFAALHHPVSRLQRLKIGTLTLGNLKPGEFRRLEPDEVQALLETAAAYRSEKARTRAKQAQRRQPAKPRTAAATQPGGSGPRTQAAAPSVPGGRPPRKPAAATAAQPPKPKPKAPAAKSRSPKRQPKGGKHEIIG